MGFVLWRLWLEIKADGATGRGFYLCKLTNFFARNHFVSSPWNRMQPGRFRRPESAAANFVSVHSGMAISAGSAPARAGSTFAPAPARGQTGGQFPPP